MLNKLVKYDLKWINKSMVIFYIISLIVCTITRVVGIYADSFIMNIIYLILKGCSYACFANMLINSVIRMWVRFNNNFYKDESYLTHTLPVSKNILYNSKMISSLISLITTLLVVAVCMAIVFLDKGMIEQLKDIFSNNNVALIFVSVIITIILEFCYMAYCGIIGSLIGHKFNNNKTVLSVVFSVALYFTIQTIMVGIVFAFGMFNQDIESLFNNSITNDKFELAVKSFILIVDMVYLVFNICFYFVGKHIFKKGVNVD